MWKCVTTTLLQVVERVSSEAELPLEHHSHPGSPLEVLNPSTTSSLDLTIIRPSNMEMVTAVTFSVGVIQTVIGLFRLGSLALVINDVLISSFTTGASIHVATSQVSHVLGLAKPAVSGPGKIVLTYIALGKTRANFIPFFYQLIQGKEIMSVNLVTICTSASCLAVLLFSDLFLSPGPRNTAGHCQTLTVRKSHLLS